MPLYFVDLKVQSTHCEKNRQVRTFTKFFEVENGENDFWISKPTNPQFHQRREFNEIKLLNLNPKPDKE
jgi:hypothetical protein